MIGDERQAGRPTNGMIGNSVHALRIADCWTVGLGAPPAPCTLRPSSFLPVVQPWLISKRHEVDEGQQCRDGAVDDCDERAAPVVENHVENKREDQGNDTDDDAVD